MNGHTQIKPGWLIGFEQLAQYVKGLSPRQASRWVAEGKLPHRRIGHRSILFRIRDVDQALQDMGREGAP